jgi:hypothetical protein
VLRRGDSPPLPFSPSHSYSLSFSNSVHPAGDPAPEARRGFLAAGCMTASARAPSKTGASWFDPALALPAVSLQNGAGHGPCGGVRRARPRSSFEGRRNLGRDGT